MQNTYRFLHSYFGLSTAMTYFTFLCFTATENVIQQINSNYLLEVAILNQTNAVRKACH